MRIDPLVDDLNKRFPRRTPAPAYRPKVNYWPIIISLVIVGLGALLITSFCHAQMISPAISECRTHCRGEMTLTNNQVVPLAVYIEPQSVTAGDVGRIFYKHLDPNVIVRLSSTSARLSPHQAYIVDYEIICQSDCVVNFSATFTGLHSNGLAVALHVGNIVYLCDKQKDCRKQTRQKLGLN